MADSADTGEGISEENLLGDGAEFVEADGPDPETSAAPEEVDTEEAELIPADAPAVSGDTPTDWISEAEQAFLDEEEGVADEAVGDETSEEDMKGVSPRMQDRLRSVISERNETRQQVEQYQQWENHARQQYSQVAQQAQGIMQQNQQLRDQLASVSARMEAFERYGNQAQSQEPEDYATKFQRETLEQAQRQAQETVNPQIEQLQAQIAQMKEVDQQRARQHQSRQNSQRIIQSTNQSVAQHLFPEGYPDDIRQKVEPVLANLSIAHSYGTGRPIPEAVKQLEGIFRSYGLGLIRAHGARGGKKLSRSQKTSSLAPQGRSTGRTSKPRISQKQAKKAGYEDALEAGFANTGLVGGED